jgi:hypothetical protein
MEQSASLEADGSSASPEILWILSNPISDYLVYTRPPPVPILSQINQVHALPSSFFKICLYINLLQYTVFFTYHQV